MEIMVDRLHKQMWYESISEEELDRSTCYKQYDRLIDGSATKYEIDFVASILNCSTEYLIGIDSSDKVCVLGTRVDIRLKCMHWSHKSLSEYIGIPVNSIRGYRSRSDNNMSYGAAQALAYGLRCSVEYLTGKSDSYGEPVKTLPLKYIKNTKLRTIPNDMREGLERYRFMPNSMHEISRYIKIPTDVLENALNGSGLIPSVSSCQLFAFVNGYAPTAVYRRAGYTGVANT